MQTPEQDRVDELEDLDPGDAHVVKKYGGLPDEQGGFDPEEESEANPEIIDDQGEYDAEDS